MENNDDGRSNISMTASSISNSILVTGGTGGSGGPGGDAGGDGGLAQGANVEIQAGHMVTAVQIINTEEHHSENYLADWLSPINFPEKHQEISGAGKLFIVYLVFDVGSLKISDITNRSKIVDHLQILQREDLNIGIGYIYISYTEAHIQSLKNLLGALWRQLQPQIMEPLDDQPARALYKTHQTHKTQATKDEVHELLKALTVQFSTVYIILDALDEYPEDKRDVLVKLLTEIGTNVQLLVTTRAQMNLSLSAEVACIEVTAAAADVRMFLSVKLQMELLRSVLNKDQLQKALEIPLQSLDVTYNLIMNSIQADKNSQVALSAFRWITFAK
uniref:Nephrocystin 3-like N-terminal domain-containing protein n=1 Tax=Mycena chlorophos TaxID=658473 RepID=A0ABQ0L0M5_MYCCL|nr:predicted protein [Mycena chlorophos]